MPLLIIIFLLFSKSPTAVFAQTVPHLSSSPVTISAAIGENQVTLTGYSSPNSLIELSNSKITTSVVSDETGFFVFDRTTLPKDPGEFCLSAIDNSFRRSSPVCIPPPPPTNYQTNIGPILLSPTITINSDQVDPNSTAVASGQSLPNSDITIHLYQVNNQAQSFPKSAQAFGFPEFTVKSDSVGNYSFSLPTTFSSDYRLYSTVNYQDNYSPKSNTLVYQLPSLFWLFWEQNSWLIITSFIFIITLTGFFYLIHLNYLSTSASLRYLPALFSYPLVKINRES